MDQGDLECGRCGRKQAIPEDGGLSAMARIHGWRICKNSRGGYEWRCVDCRTGGD